MFWTKWPGKSHQDVPYGFKVDALRKAQGEGYEQVFWLDSSCVAERSLDQAWEQLERDGYFLPLEGWTVGDWCNDHVLEMAGYTREQAKQIPLMGGGFVGVDLSSPIGNRFLDKWERARDQGWFNGSWDDHRHDLPAGAIIAYEMGLNLTPNVWHYAKDPRHPDNFFVLKGTH